LGIDLLDIQFRIERQFKVTVSQDDWESLLTAAHPRDILAGDLFDLIHRRRSCRYCARDLHRYGREGVCPECRTPYRFDAQSADREWALLREILSDALNVKAEDITMSSLLIKDLGMT
jgi:acyl carrier protein